MHYIRLWTWLLPVFFMVMGESVHSVEGCAAKLAAPLWTSTPVSTAYGMVDEFHLPPELARRPTVQDLFPDATNDDIFVGLVSNHVYAIVNGRRFDGGFLGYSPERASRYGYFSPGVFLRVRAQWWIPKNFSPARGIGCARSVNERVARETGVVLTPGQNLIIRPSRWMEEVMANHELIVDKYALNADFEETLALARDREISLMYTAALGGPAVGTVATLIGTMLVRAVCGY